jgi:mono/diheme cytochrome c family protein
VRAELIGLMLLRRAGRTLGGVARPWGSRSRQALQASDQAGGATRQCSRVRSLPTLVLVAGLTAAGGCEWFTDFERQPTISTWEVVGDSTRPSRGSPMYSVPITGMAVSALQVSYRALPGVIDSMSAITNPVAADARSLENGRKYYQINCAVCHGDRGAGDGLAVRFGMAGINVVSDVTRARSDGYMFGMIRNGRGLMPTYNRIEEPDRWDVVNYLRALQSGAQVATGEIAAPGVTGRALPGATRTAPTRSAPYRARLAATDTAARADTAIPPRGFIAAPGDTGQSR